LICLLLFISKIYFLYFILIFFNSKDVKLSEILYEPVSYSCSSCNMKFDNQINLDKHLNWHFETNMKLLNKSINPTGRPQLVAPKVLFSKTK